MQWEGNVIVVSQNINKTMFLDFFCNEKQELSVMFRGKVVLVLFLSHLYILCQCGIIIQNLYVKVTSAFTLAGDKYSRKVTLLLLSFSVDRVVSL